MKHLLIGLAALMISFSVGADDMAAPKGTPGPAASEAKGAAKATGSSKKHTRATKRRLPSGDIRHCLELKTNEEIIRCSEGR